MRRWLDTLPETAYTEIRAIGASPTAARINDALDLGALESGEAERARVVVEAVVEDAMKGIRFERDPVGLVKQPYQFDMWKDARPYLRGTPEHDPPTAPIRFESGVAAAALARPSTSTRHPGLITNDAPTPAADLSPAAEASPGVGI
ncbi:hypothetical protein ACL02S_23410 [Nocardia sp. 004]|uniref:hypothetical protein n=1 Tax=Nocardia sp. 004 TaxID=3385978 RepID=UPI0039A175E2